MLYSCKIIIFSFILCASQIHAKNKIFINSMNKCIPTKNIIDNYEPLNFNLSNNLIVSSKIQENTKEIPKILVFGKLLDRNCIPVANANIYAWQVGIDGKYPYEPLRQFAVDKNLFSKKPTSFLGSATTQTDNNGNFVLIATYPKKNKYPTTHGINIRAEHKNLGKVQIRFDPIAFYEEVRSIKYLSFYKSDMDDSNVKAYNLKIILDASNTFLKY